MRKNNPEEVEPRDPIEQANPVPSRRVIRCYRVILWIMPACIAFPTFYLFISLVNRNSSVGPLAFAIWILFNVASTIVLGWFDACLGRGENPPAEFNNWKHTIFFVVLQVIEVPLLGIVIGQALP